MSLYAIGDLHLAFSVDKPMDLFGRGWKNHEKKIEKYWRRRVRPEDTVVLTGDHSWGAPCRSARQIWILSSTCLGGKFCFGATMTCSGTPKRQKS